MFEGLDAIFLARLQFAFTVSFHFIFPAFSIGLASYPRGARGAVAVDRPRGLSRPLQLLAEDLRPRLRHGRRVGHRHVLPVRHQLVGLLRQGRAGDRPADGLRGADRLLPRGGLPGRHAVRHEPGRQGAAFRRHAGGRGRHLHLGLLDPVGQQLDADAGGLRDQRRDGQFVPVDWWAVIFNPSFPYRLVHTVLAAYLTTALVVGAVGAWHLLRERGNEGARVMFSMAMWMVSRRGAAPDLRRRSARPQHAGAPAGQGHGHGRPLREPSRRRAADPVRLARRGGSAETATPIEIPKASSLILKHSLDAPLTGPRHGRPQGLAAGRPIVFWAFRIMVGLGMLMLALGVWSACGARCATGSTTGRWLHRFALVMGPAGFVAVIAGWVTTEVGRQPYTVYGLLRTADSRLAARTRRPWRPRWWPSSSSTSSCSAPASSTSCKLMGQAPHRGERGRSATSRCAPPASRPRRPCPTPSARRGRSDHAHLDLPIIWAGHHRLRRSSPMS